MKKLAFLFVAIAAVSFVACGNSGSQSETTTETDSVAVEEVEAVEETVVDSTAADSAVVADTTATEATPAAE